VGVTELASYEEVRRTQLEAAVNELAAQADVVIDGLLANRGRCVSVQAASRLGLVGGEPERLC